MTIRAPMVKKLRKLTSAGIMECKKALIEADGDMEKAIISIRKSGQAKVVKRLDRVTAEGTIRIARTEDGKRAVMVELNSETDFVARDENFQAFADMVVTSGLNFRCNSLKELLNQKGLSSSKKTIEELRADLALKTSENIQIRRFVALTSPGIVGSYLHGYRIGVLVSLDQENAELSHDIAIHVAAMNPLSIDQSKMSPELISKERDIFFAQSKKSGKPDDIVEKMVEGKVSKFIKENCLVDQPFVKDPKQPVSVLLKAADAKVEAMVRFELGEGVEKESVSFAEEVHSQIRGN